MSGVSPKLQVHEGHHPPIVTLDLWDEVQQSLCDHLGAARTKRTRQSSDALLTGKLYDDGGNRMPDLGEEGVCIKRLTDLPMLWSEQWGDLGLQEPVQLQAEPS